MALLIINLTPASAFDMAGIQNNVNKMDNYAHGDWWYKFWHFFEFIDSMGSLLSQVVDTANELPSDLQRGVDILPKALSDRNELDERNEKLKAMSNYYSNDTLKSKWVNDTDESNELENDIINNNTPNTNNLNETNTNTKKTTQTTTNTVGNSINSSVNQSSDKLGDDEVNNESSIENSTKNTSKKHASNPPKEVMDHAAYIQNQLSKEGIDVKVVHYNLDQLHKDYLVQLVDIQGFIKYMVYEGNTTQDGHPAVILYNGESDQTVTYNKFVNAYTGIVLELKTNNNDTNVTTTDLAEKIYSTHLNILTQKIGVFSDWIAVGTALEWLGGAVAALTAVVGTICAAIALCVSKTAGIVVAIIAAIITTIIVVIGLAILATGILLVCVIQKNSDDTKAEKDDLTTQCI
ncbi:MAG: hypothetical protein F8N39_04940 [Clostridiaceae bacterium]|nr:hypothetical protein [Clostridiaceae bacterium]